MTKVASKKNVAPVAEAPKKKGWRIKSYYVDLKVYNQAEIQEALKDAPNQVRIMMAHFASNFNEEAKAGQGRVLCQDAIDKGGLKTVIEPAVLFAYYRSKMETFGLKLK